MGLLLGIILIGLGGYIAWESHSILNWPLFQMTALANHNVHITATDLQYLNSFLTDFLSKLGADTWGAMQRYLTISRIGGIVIAILGLIVSYQYVRRRV